MDSKINLVFEISKLKLLDENDEFNWFDFVSNLIYQSGDRCSFYFLLDSNELMKNENFSISELEEKRDLILKKLKYKKIKFDKSLMSFGLYSDHTKFESKSSIWFFDLNKLDDVTHLTNDLSIFFFSDYEMGEALYYSNFFEILLDFENTLDDSRKRKKILKIANNVVNVDNYQELNYEKISYEFLTFIETKNNI